VVTALLPSLRRRHAAHLVVCNAENSAAGFGLTREAGTQLREAGCDVLTGGNHLWDRREGHDYIAAEPRLVRPANLPPGVPGQGWRVFQAADGTAVGVVNLLGRVYMKEADDPFRAADAAIAALRPHCRVILVDVHAETTAEKEALAWHLDGRVSAVIGTHTHVQTADERILPGGTAFLCDAGRTGSQDSVIGMEKEPALRRFLTGLPARLAPAHGDLWLNGAVLSIDPASGRTLRIERVREAFDRDRVRPALRLLKGDAPAEAVTARAREEVSRLRTAGVAPTLALVSVGEDPASRIYLRKKGELCAAAGIEARRVQFPAGTTTDEVLARVTALGDDPAVHGILVQLPLAAPADAQPVLEAIPPAKDVDGFHPANVGRLAVGLPALAPATPAGILELLRHYRVPLAGMHAVVLGRSNIVGRPLATLLSQKGVDCTVTLGHSGSGARLRELARTADLLVCAIGRPEMVDATWVRPGAVVVDVGIHRVARADAPGKTRLTGDVEPVSVSEVAAALTPVPGGVGPMTVAMVVANTALAAGRQAAAAGVAGR
jgi:methylenetetrahydrofolate dehydrogenase (NADP+)/methenyltetrahydrofolate cyclohydrolase